MKRELKDQVAYQEMEVLFSNDFEKMSLKQLKGVNEMYLKLHGANSDTLHWSSDQYKAWQFMHFCIKKL